MTNLNLFNHMWFWGLTFSIGIGVLSGYLAFDNLFYLFCNSYDDYSSNYRCRYFRMKDIQDGITAGGCLTAIGGFFGLCSCFWLGKRLKKAEQMTATRTAIRNTTLTETPIVQNLGTEVNSNHEVIELSPLGQEVKNLGAEATNSEQDQNQQITELQRRLTQLENQINQQQEAKIEVITS